AGKRDRKDEQEGDRVAAEEAEAADRRSSGGTEHERNRGREPAGLQREDERVTRLGVVPGGVEPLRAEAGDRPALDVRGADRVDADQDERDPQEEHDEQSPQTEGQPCRARFHYSASNAPRRFASVR